jgi:hypothetical protein
MVFDFVSLFILVRLRSIENKLEKSASIMMLTDLIGKDIDLLFSVSTGFVLKILRGVGR